MVLYTFVCVIFSLQSDYLSSGEPFAGDCSVGQLTKTGFHQEVQNGMYLRNAYVENPFLSATYDRSEIYIKSDGNDISCT